MEHHFNMHSICCLLILVCFMVFACHTHAREQLQHNNKLRNNSSVTAIFVFGDSTVDPGNNNYVKTIFKGNFPPYGIDFANQEPTGRFTNGRLATDFIVSYAGIKEYVPPYLDPTLSIEELKTGVSFASAGSGFDPLTPSVGNVLSLPKQIEYFKEYKTRLESAIGKPKTKHIIKKAIFLVSAGTNDFVVSYFSLPLRRKQYSVADYQQFVLKQAKQFIQDLLDEGAQRIAVVNLPPIGCLPVMITLNSDQALASRQCIDQFSSMARDYNAILQSELDSIQAGLAFHDAKIYYCDIYSPLTDMIQNNHKYGFEEVSSGCCGTGLLETGFLCNPKSFLCPDASKYVFWDSIHPTEKAYNIIFQAVRPIIDQIVMED